MKWKKLLSTVSSIVAWFKCRFIVLNVGGWYFDCWWMCFNFFKTLTHQNFQLRSARGDKRWLIFYLQYCRLVNYIEPFISGMEMKERYRCCRSLSLTSMILYVCSLLFLFLCHFVPNEFSRKDFDHTLDKKVAISYTKLSFFKRIPYIFIFFFSG